VAGMAQATGQGLGLGPRAVCGGPGPGQACRRAGAVGDAGVGPLRVDGLVSPRGGGANAVQPGQGADEPPETPAARADCATGQMEGPDPSGEARPSRAALHARSHRRTAREGGGPQAPGWPRGARPLEGVGGATRGEPLRAHLPGLRHEVGAFAALPAWLAPLGDGWPVLAEDAHGTPLGASRACVSSWLRRARSPSRFNR